VSFPCFVLATILSVVSVAPDQTVSLKSLASAYAASGDPRARETYERALAESPRDLPLRVEFAEYLWRSGEPDLGNDQMEQVIRLAPDNPRLKAHYGANLAGQKKYGKAVEQLDAARRGGFDDPNVLLFLGSALWEIGRLDEAKERLTEAAARAPERAAPRHRLGRLLLLQGDPAGAAAELLRATQLDPDSAEIAIDLGRALEASGDSAGAERAYRQALAHEPAPPLAHYRLGTLLARTGRREEAGRHLALYKESFEREQSQQFRSRSRQAELNLGRALLSDRRFGEALAQFDRLPDDPEALLGAARALSGLGRNAEAVRKLERALERDPGNSALRSELDAARERASKK
jgi:tetratricopeptide (TPR) repeat protein